MKSKNTTSKTAASQLKIITASLDSSDTTKVKVTFKGKYFTPEEFTSIFMSILEDYTVSLLKNNTNEAIYEHFNSVFGLFLAKLLPPSEIYKKSVPHKEFKEVVDSTLGAENTPEVKKSTEDNRFAAYLICRDILTKEIGLTEESAYELIRKRLFLSTPVGASDGKEE